MNINAMADEDFVLDRNALADERMREILHSRPMEAFLWISTKRANLRAVANLAPVQVYEIGMVDDDVAAEPHASSNGHERPDDHRKQRPPGRCVAAHWRQGAIHQHIDSAAREGVRRDLVESSEMYYSRMNGTSVAPCDETMAPVLPRARRCSENV